MRIFRISTRHDNLESIRCILKERRISSEFGAWVNEDEVGLAAENVTIGARLQLSSNELLGSHEVGLPRQKESDGP